MRLLLTVFSIWLCVSSNAAIAIVLDAVDSGFYVENGFSDPGSNNYLVGYDTSLEFGIESRNYFVFDLTPIDTAISATLRAYMGDSPPNTGPGYISPDPFETWALFEVDTAVDELMNNPGFLNISTFIDLGNGPVFGEAVLTAADKRTYVEVALNAEALNAINSTNGLWAIGGAITSLTGGAETEVAFAWSFEDPRVELVIGEADVPSPSTLILLAVGFALLVLTKRRAA